MRDLSHNQFYDIYHRPHLSTAEKAVLMGNKLHDKSHDFWPEYAEFRDSQRDTGRELAAKIDPLPESLFAKMDTLLERARNRQSPTPHAELESATEKLSREITDTQAVLFSAILDIPRAKDKVAQVQNLERNMEQSGLTFTTSDSAFMQEMDTLNATRGNKYDRLKNRGFHFMQEMKAIVTQMKADERRAGWQGVFNYIAHGDPDSPGLTAPPRAQFKKRPTPKV